VRVSTSMRRWPRLAIATTAVAVAGVVAAVAFAAEPAIKTFTPRSENQITNIDVLRQQIRNYYGDPLGSGTFADDSYYAKEARSIADSGSRWLAQQAHSYGPKGYTSTKGNGNGNGNGDDRRGRGGSRKKLAIVLDVDDTTLATWNYEIFSNWAYNPTTNATYVNGQLFPAVPGMVDMVKKAKAEGYAIFFLTGRPSSQEAPTLGNLTSDGVGVDAGYPAPTDPTKGEDGLYTKPAVGSYPDFLNKSQFCADAIAAGTSCPTVLYKSGVRAHLESLGYDIVANFGDQPSDLDGGYADKTFKMPNPNYYLP
jgi:HAD superfamily, subfamily IIIB (Acid phosphatase)